MRRSIRARASTSTTWRRYGPPSRSCSTPPAGVARTIPQRATAVRWHVSSPTSESTMDLSTLSHQLSDQLVAFAWDEWAQMGLLVTSHRRSAWAQDPEALIVFTLEVARAEPRLFDELLDWILLNESLLSVRRLRAVCVDETDRTLTAAALGWLARPRPPARLNTRGPASPTATLQPLFRSEGPMRD